ncbi:transposase, partial [Shigella flexneri]
SWQHYPRIYSFMFSRHPGRAYQQLWWTTINFCHFAFDV